MSSGQHASPMRRNDTRGNDIVVEKTFDVDVDPDHAWEKLARFNAEHDPAPGTWWLPGFRCRATEIEATPGHRLEVVKAEQPCRGTTIVFTFEHCHTGTRITVIQSGFDPGFVQMAGEDFWAHGTSLLDDVERVFRGGAARGAS